MFFSNPNLGASEQGYRPLGATQQGYSGIPFGEDANHGFATSQYRIARSYPVRRLAPHFDNSLNRAVFAFMYKNKQPEKIRQSEVVCNLTWLNYLLAKKCIQAVSQGRNYTVDDVMQEWTPLGITTTTGGEEQNAGTGDKTTNFVVRGPDHVINVWDNAKPLDRLYFLVKRVDLEYPIQYTLDTHGTAATVDCIAENTEDPGGSPHTVHSIVQVIPYVCKAGQWEPSTEDLRYQHKYTEFGFVQDEEEYGRYWYVGRVYRSFYIEEKLQTGYTDEQKVRDMVKQVRLDQIEMFVDL